MSDVLVVILILFSPFLLTALYILVREFLDRKR